MINQLLDKNKNTKDMGVKNMIDELYSLEKQYVKKKVYKNDYVQSNSFIYNPGKSLKMM
jgi:hypothetical protein